MKKKSKLCQGCGKRFKPTTNWQQYCNDCYAEKGLKKLKRGKTEKEDEE